MTDKNKIYSWHAPEFRHYEKNLGWYVVFVSISVLFVLFFMLIKDLFAAICVAILAGLVGYFSSQKPNVVPIELTSKHVRFGNIVFPYKQLKNFWIVNTDHHKTLNFQTSTIVNNVVVIELMDQDEEEIREFLLRYLPEHHLTTATFAQRVSHKLKF